MEVRSLLETDTFLKENIPLKDGFQDIGCETDEFIQRLYKGKTLAKMYATYRPPYPRKIFDEIMSFHNEVSTNGHQLAVDVCCGTGLSTLPLVVGVDVSEDLMEYMPKDVPNLTTHVCPAENMTMIDSSTVDLVTVATGLHWLNIEKFLQEVKRILKPDGTFAAYSRFTGRLETESANQLYKDFLMKFKDFMTSKSVVVYEKYRSTKFPFQDFRRFEMEVLDEMTIGKLKGYLSSVHFLPLYNEVNPGNDELGRFGNSLEAIINPEGKSSQPIMVKLYNGVFLVMGRNSHPGS
ncbi:S-adenosylmethionine-dependent methyltransferase [Bulinus truncatus]|nr:S-adenosylmethionine-dependent methyltransferase [Bulinus truncatus]